MPDAADKPEQQADAESPDEGEDAESPDEGENERPTVNPPFDPVAFAREFARRSPAPIPAVRPPPSAEPRAADPPAWATAPGRAGAAGLRPPPTSPASPAARSAPRQTPPSTLSLANAYISSLPPRPDAPRQETTQAGNLDPVHAPEPEWRELELAPQAPSPDEPASEHPARGALFEAKLDLDAQAASRQREPASDSVHGPPAHATSKPRGSGKTRQVEMTDRVSLGDFSGALEIAEQILSENPRDSAAKTCAENCRTVLRQMYATRIGPLDRVPVVTVSREQLRWLSIDHRAGFVLALVDGVSTVEMILDVSGMAELDALRILSELLQQRIIALR